MKKVKLRRDDHTLIASLPQDDNDLVDKHFSDIHQIKSMYYDNEDRYVESNNLNQDERYNKKKSMPQKNHSQSTRT